MASAIAGMTIAAENRHLFDNQSPKYTCKDCCFYTGNTYCKQVRRNINKQTPANRCVFFK